MGDVSAFAVFRLASALRLAVRQDKGFRSFRVLRESDQARVARHVLSCRRSRPDDLLTAAPAGAEVLTTVPVTLPTIMAASPPFHPERSGSAPLVRPEWA